MTKIQQTLLPSIVLLLHCATVCHLEELYVDSSASDKNSLCTQKNPCGTLHHAINCSQPDDVILLLTGPNYQPYSVNSLTISWSLKIKAAKASIPPVISCLVINPTCHVEVTTDNPTNKTEVIFQDVTIKGCNLCSKNSSLRFNDSSMIETDLTASARNKNEIVLMNSTLNGTTLMLAGLCGNSDPDDTCKQSSLIFHMQDCLFFGPASGLILKNVSEVEVSMKNVKFSRFDSQVTLSSTNSLDLLIDQLTIVDFDTDSSGLTIDSCKGNLTGAITNSYFVNNTFIYDGAVSLKSGNTSIVDLSITNTVFRNNSCETSGSGIHLRLMDPRQENNEGEIVKSMKQHIHIDSCNFTKNENGESAAAVYISGGNVTITDSLFSENKVRTDLSVRTKSAERKGAGGAIYGMSISNVIIDNCIFYNNSANWFGGAIAGSSAFRLTNIYFETARLSHSTLGEVLYLSGPVKVANLTVNVIYANRNVPMIWYSSNQENVFEGIDSGYLNFNCPSGAQFRNESLPVLDNDSAFSDLFYFCDPCKDGTYSLQHGYRTGPLDESTGNWSSNFQCLPCSYGGVCNKGRISSQFNFWGYADGNPPQVSMRMCPEGYCCQKAKCDTFYACAGNRTGTLCGQCKAGMSEKLFTTDCVDNKTCKDAWVFAVDILTAMVTVLFFLYQIEIVAFACKYLFWADVTENDDPTFAGYLKSVFYFYQTIDLLKVQANQASKIVGVAIQPLISYLLSFKSIAIIFGACPFHGMTPATKTVLKSMPTIYVLSFLGLLTLVYTIVKIKQKKDTSTYVHFNRQTSTSPAMKKSFGSRIAMACLSYFLYNYISISNMTFTLLACIPFANKSVLYIDGNVECIQPWQSVFIIVAIIHVCPFFMAVIASRYLYDRNFIGTKQFFASYFLPLPMLIFWAIRYFTKWKSLKGIRIEDAMDDSVALQPKPPMTEDELLKASILGMIEEPFINHTNAESVRYWEGILIFRRLVLSALAAFTVQPLLSITLQTLTCFAFLLWHVHVHPFGTKAANNFETVSLSILTVVSICHIIQATLLSSGIPAIGPNKTQIFITDWIEWLLVNLFPMLLGLALVVFIIVHIFMACASACKHLYITTRYSGSGSDQPALL